MMKNQKGITLIALVVTIIVLLILAGVSIAMLTGDNGILTQANAATVTTIEGNVDEQVRMAVAALRLAIANEAADDASYDAREETKTLTDDVKEDLVETSGKSTSDWTVTPTPADDTEDTEDASFTIAYSGADYTNAKNDSTAKIMYAVRINQQTVELSDSVVVDKDNSSAEPTVPDAE